MNPINAFLHWINRPRICGLSDCAETVHPTINRPAGHTNYCTPEHQDQDRAEAQLFQGP